jgi:hypothetical protein
MDRLIREVGEQVAGRLRTGEGSVDDIARELHEKLMLRGEEGRSLRIENICACLQTHSERYVRWLIFTTSSHDRPRQRGVNQQRRGLCPGAGRRVGQAAAEEGAITSSSGLHIALV